MDFRTYAAHELAALADKLADAARAQSDAATAQVTASFEASVDKLRADQTQIVTDNERLTAENAALTWEKNELIEAARTSGASALLERLAEVFERIARSSTVDELLVATASGLSANFGRVAVFRNGRFLTQLGARSALLDQSSSSVVAVPIIVRGEALAVIYADDEARPDGEGARLAGLLRRHVTLALERLTIELKTLAELRAYAQMLLDEVEYVFEADTTSVNAEERSGRLRENLRCARQIYLQRVTLEGPAAASVLDEVVARIVEKKAETAFGRELANLENAAGARSG